MKLASEKLEDLRPGDHACLLWETEDDHRNTVSRFLGEGIQRGEKVIYFIDSHDSSIIVEYLYQAGVNVGRCLTSGQLSVFNATSVYMRTGTFDPEGMLRLLQTETQQAVAKDYTALRVTGEMTWSLQHLPGTERLFDYESTLNAVFPEKCTGLCQYHCRQFSPSMLWHSVVTHPIVSVGGTCYRNRYYIAPATFLEPEARSAIMCAQLEQPDELVSPTHPARDCRDIESMLLASR